MNKHKLIMEGWRDFLSNDTTKEKKFEDPFLSNKFSLFIYQNSQTKLLLLYLPKKNFLGREVQISEQNPPTPVGMILLNKTKGPCVPKTFQVSQVAVAKPFRKKGIGMSMYDFAASLAKEDNNSGITSDHIMSTSNSAKRDWNKIEKSSNYQKRKTPKGNEKFDYSGEETPDDKLDDCENASDPKNTVDYSYQISQDKIEKIKELNDNHQKVYQSLAKKAFPNINDYEDMLQKMAFELFNIEYGD